MVVNTCNPSSLKIWTMFRLEVESISLKIYVPAGKTWAPEPGTSTGALNVTVVRLFHSSAAAVGNKNAQAARTLNTIDNILISFICCSFSHVFSFPRPRDPRSEKTSCEPSVLPLDHTH